MEKFTPDLVVSDFDGTITQKMVNWKVIPSLISILRDNNWFLDEDYKKKANQLYNKYSKIEKDPNLPYEEKFNAMKSWWKEHYDLLKEKWLTQELIKQAVYHPDAKIREWFDKFVEILRAKNIPLIVFSSSGLGDDSIRLTFEKFGIPMDNVVILSNKLKFDENWKFVGVDEKDLIHGMNKKLKDHLDKEEIKKVVEWKKKVLLLGDSLHDPEMLEGMDFDKVLNIWFFIPKNSNKEEELKAWEKVYDIILPWDADFSKIIEIIQ